MRSNAQTDANMTAADFILAADAHKIRGGVRKALSLVLVDGLTAYQAALDTGVTQGGISRAKKRILRQICPHCARPMAR